MPEENKPTDQTNGVKIPVSFGAPQSNSTPIAPAAPVNRTEQLLAEAAKEIDHEDDTPTPGKVQVGKVKKSRKGLIFLILLLLVAGGGAYWYLKIYKKPVAQTNTQATPVVKTEVKQTFEPENIIYTKAGTDKKTYTIYSQPVSGGKPVELKKITFPETYWNGISGDISGTSIVLVANDKISTSQDSGKTFKDVITLKADEQITSIKLSTDGKSFAYAHLPKAGSKATIKSSDLNGKAGDDLLTSEFPGVFLQRWDKKLNKIAYDEGCFNCDGNVPGIKIRDLSTGKDTLTLKYSKDKLNIISQPVISPDFATVYYAEGIYDATREHFLGDFADPPIVVKSMDIASSKKTEYETIGKKGDKNADGTPKYYPIYFELFPSSSNPFYLNQKNVSQIKDGKTSIITQLTLEAAQLYAVSDKTIILSQYKTAKKDSVEFDSYDIATKKLTKIFEEPTTTLVLGVTTK